MISMWMMRVDYIFLAHSAMKTLISLLFVHILKMSTLVKQESRYVILLDLMLYYWPCVYFDVVKFCFSLFSKFEQNKTLGYYIWGDEKYVP